MSSSFEAQDQSLGVSDCKNSFQVITNSYYILPPNMFSKRFSTVFLLFCHPICSQKYLALFFDYFATQCFQKKKLALFFLFISVYIYIFSLSHLVRISLEAKYLQHLSAQLIYYISLRIYLLCESASVSDPV